MIELVVSLLILVLLIAIASPSFEQYRSNRRLRLLTSDFVASVQLARAEAVRRQKIVSMCPTQSVGARSPTCSEDPNFAAWIVFEDGDGDCLPVAGVLPIRAAAAIAAEESSRIAARGSGVCISFAVTGALRSVQDLRTADRLLICDARGIGTPDSMEPSAARGVSIDSSGRVSVTRQRQAIRAWRLSCPPGNR